MTMHLCLIRLQWLSPQKVYKEIEDCWKFCKKWFSIWILFSFWYWKELSFWECWCNILGTFDAENSNGNVKTLSCFWKCICCLYSWSVFSGLMAKIWKLRSRVFTSITISLETRVISPTQCSALNKPLKRLFSNFPAEFLWNRVN